MTTKPTMTRPWSEIAELYADLVARSDSKGTYNWGLMLRFVRQIEQSDYANGLFGWTSHADLHITQTPVEYPYFGPQLAVLPRRDGTVEFRYIDSHVTEKQWHRTVDASDAFARLEGFLDQLHWFVKYKPVTQTERE